MSVSKLVFLLIITMLGNFIHAQRIVIKDLNESEYPLIKVQIEFDNLSEIDLNKLQVREKGELTVFSLDSVSEAPYVRLVSILVDGAILYKPNAIEGVLNSIIELTDVLNNSDLLNVFIAKNNADTLSCLSFSSFEYTSDYQNFTTFLNGYLSQFRNNQKNTSLSCAFDEAIDFLKAKKLPKGQKSFFIISDLNKESSEEWIKIIGKSRDFGIEPKLVNISKNDNNTDSRYQLIKEFKSLNAAIDLNNSNKIKSYIISFYTTQNSNENQFEIKYGNQIIRRIFFKPGHLFFSKDNYLFLIITGVLFLLSIIFIINLLYTKKRITRSLKKLKNKQELENSDKSQLISETISTKQTLYGNGSVIPYVTIDIDGNIIKHELKKLRTTIGRHSDNDILIANLTISNHHAAITNEGGIFYIQDNESTNGTFVNEIKISKSAIKSGDSVRLGKAKLFLTY